MKPGKMDDLLTFWGSALVVILAVILIATSPGEAPERIVTLYSADGSVVAEWKTESSIWSSRDGSIRFRIADGQEVVVRGMFTILPSR